MFCICLFAPFQPTFVGSCCLATPTFPFVLKVKGQGYRVKKIKFQHCSAEARLTKLQLGDNAASEFVCHTVGVAHSQ